MRRAAALAVMVSLLAASGAACRRQERLDPGQARVVPDEGATALVAGGEGDLQPATGGARVGAGDRVGARGGVVTLSLAGGGRLELAAGAEVRVGEPTSLLSGSALVLPPPARSLTVEAAGTEVTALGPARVTRDLAVTAASYRTGLRIASAGRRLRVPPLRQASVASLGELPDEPVPLAYDPGDPWDRRYLGSAAGLAEQLEARSRGFTSALARGEGSTAGFYRLLLPALEAEPGFGEALLSPRRPPGEVLVGLALALAGQGGSFASRWREVFAFRDAGADWGLVALDQRVEDPPAVVAAVDEAIGRAPLAVSPPPSPRPPAGPPPGPPATAPRPPGAPPTTAPPTTAPGAPPTSAPPPTAPPPLLTPLAELLAGLLPGLVTVEP